MATSTHATSLLEHGTAGNNLLRPACFKLLLNVTTAPSSPNLSGTVTRPGFAGCLC